jgi:hypothetical protein
MPHLARLTFRLARNPKAGYPEGADDRGYVLIAPLNKDNMLNLDLWRTRRYDCTVKRFSPVNEECADGLLTHRGSHWRFAYDEDDEGPDEAGWKLAAHRLEVGAYVTIANGDGESLVYKITDSVRL